MTLCLHSGQAQQVVADERLRLAGQELSQSRERLKAGVAGNIEVIDAQSNLIRARDTDIDARFAAASAHVSLARAAGGAPPPHYNPTTGHQLLATTDQPQGQRRSSAAGAPPRA